MTIRNFLFDMGLLSQIEHHKPIISVGNLAVGGTGKTPMIEYLIKALGTNRKIVTLSRGYGRKSAGFIRASKKESADTIGDEPAQLYAKFRNIEVTVCESRTKGLKAIDDLKIKYDLVLLDDAFQHRHVKPGLSILLTTFTNPYFQDFVMPAGQLRESRSGAKRADLVVVTKCPPSLSQSQIHDYSKRLSATKDQEIFFTQEKYSGITKISNGTPSDFDSLKDKRIVLITGIANASSMMEFVKKHGQIVKHFEFSDHHRYSETELDTILAFPAKEYKDNILFLTTEKDAQRLRVLNNFGKFASSQSFTLPLSISFYEGQEEVFLNRIKKYVESNK